MPNFRVNPNTANIYKYAILSFMGLSLIGFGAQFKQEWDAYMSVCHPTPPKLKLTLQGRQVDHRKRKAAEELKEREFSDDDWKKADREGFKNSYGNEKL